MAITELFAPDSLSVPAVLLRLTLATIVGGVIGFEREHHGRAAGLRTTMLVCLAACVAAVLSEYLFHEAGGAQLTWRPDPARLAQGILAGMGFLGAGVVVREGKFVRGVTTAAVLWFVTVIGLTLGSGHYLLGVLGFALSMLALLLLPHVERLIAADLYGAVIVTVGVNGPSNEDLCKVVTGMGLVVKEVAFDIDLVANTRTVRMSLKFRGGDVMALADKLRAGFAGLAGVQRIQWL